MLKYCTGLQSVGSGEPSLIAAITSRMSEYLQLHSPRNGLFKGEPDIVGEKFEPDVQRPQGFLRYLERPLGPLQPRPARNRE